MRTHRYNSEFIRTHFAENEVKVSFESYDKRYPMIGIFVFVADAEDLAKKDMVRFVHKANLDLWDGETDKNTKIFKISDFSLIQTM